MIYTYYDSPLGKILLTCDGDALTGLYFENQKHYPEKSVISKAEHADAENSPLLSQVKIWLDDYFNKKRPSPNKINLALNGSEFEKDVWKMLLNIPYGETITYGEAAKIIAEKRGLKNMSAQAVGGAVGRNKISIIIPCHRVIGKNGALTGYAGGIERKEKLLLLENPRNRS